MESFLSLILLSLISADVPQPKIEWNCAAEQWLVEPALDDEGDYSAALISECSVTSPKGKVLNLDQYLLSKVGEGTTIHEGPIQETYAELPSVRYDLSLRLDNDGQPITIRSDVHFATDAQKRFVYASDSKRIEASGTASYLRKVTERVAVTSASDGKFNFSVSSSIEVEKPWYAPSGSFLNQMTKAFINNFREARDQRVPSWGAKL